MTTKFEPNDSHSLGVLLPNGCRIVHQPAAHNKRPFPEMIPDLAMTELDPGERKDNTTYSGQFGLIHFNTSFRLPRHVHISGDKFVTERILVLNGIALVELNGDIYIVAPETLVVIAPGVPHTWTACPAGVELPPFLTNGSFGGREKALRSEGSFLMVYEYEEQTKFYATEQTVTLTRVDDYIEYRGDLENIRFPRLSAADVREKASSVLGEKLMRLNEA